MSKRDSSVMLGFVKALLANVAGILKSRLQLFAMEAAGEGRRILLVLILAVAALFCGGMAFILLNVTIVFLFWESAQLAVLIGLTCFYVLLVAAIAVGFRIYLKRWRMPFADTINEFKKDFECLRRRD